MKVEFIAAVIRQLGREVGCDEHALVAVRFELMLDGGKRDRPIDRLDLGKKAISPSIRFDLDRRVRACARRALRLAGDDRRGESRGARQRGKRVVQDSGFSLRLLVHGESRRSSHRRVHVT
ncbi:MAG: hypothetical protein HYV94_08240 [Candidatus Rokubacteria bacterium]|nr:hypothetical protein [Candidatus Rokubacteria bacterium]